MLPAVDLPQRLVQHDADRRRQVQTADLTGWHGDRQGAIRMPLQGFVRQPVRFAAEEEYVAGLETGRGVGLLAAGREAEHPVCGLGRLELSKTGMPMHLDGRPVIEPRA